MPYDPGPDVIEVVRAPKGGPVRGTYRAFGETLRGLRTTLGRWVEGTHTYQYKAEDVHDFDAALHASTVIVGEKLLRDFGWKVGDNVTLQGTIFPGDWTFTIRGTYKPTLKEYGEDSFMFHYSYLYEKYPDRVTPGWFIMKIDVRERSYAGS